MVRGGIAVESETLIRLLERGTITARDLAIIPGDMVGDHLARAIPRRLGSIKNKSRAMADEVWAEVNKSLVGHLRDKIINGEREGHAESVRLIRLEAAEVLLGREDIKAALNGCDQTTQGRRLECEAFESSAEALHRALDFGVWGDTERRLKHYTAVMTSVFEASAKWVDRKV